MSWVAIWVLFEIGTVGEILWLQVFYFDREFLGRFIWGWRLLIVSIVLALCGFGGKG